MGQVHLALLWHQHQPYYPDPFTGEITLPWTRLHAIKDYYGMAKLLLEVPEVKAVINLVPSLLIQMEDFASRRSADAYFKLSQRLPSELSEKERAFVVETFFSAHWDHMVKPFPRYWELLGKRAFETKKPEEAARQFSEADLRDLQVLFNLAWFHPTLIVDDPVLAAMAKKERNFTEDDKRAVLEKEYEIVGRVIPMHKELMARGQVELTTTPFYHPILPLLMNMESARMAMPGTALPATRPDYRADAVIQVKRGLDEAERHFGFRPRGMWPSEGSVSEDVAMMLAENGVSWVATDEEILQCSLGGAMNPGVLYHPWTFERDGKKLDFVFRDHALSDHLGFHYQHRPAGEAVDDFIRKIKRGWESGLSDPLVTVALDGENAWEHYPGGGVEFLRTLYRGLAKAGDVKTTTVSEFLQKFPERPRLPRLHAGSWICHNFAIWIGHREDVAAWEQLGRTRNFLEKNQANVPPDVRAKAWEEIYIAEGSDWYWWYGDDHSSGNDAEFDRLFRSHLKKVYRLLGAEPPIALDDPITEKAKSAALSMPRSFLPIRIDGRVSDYFEWISAGRYTPKQERGAMEVRDKDVIKDLYFGFDESTFYLRVDFTEGRKFVRKNKWLSVILTKPEGVKIEIPLDKMQMRIRKKDSENQTDAVAFESVLELGAQLSDIGSGPGQTVNFFVEVGEGDALLQRCPPQGVIALAVPTKDFEFAMWQV